MSEQKQWPGSLLSGMPLALNDMSCQGTGFMNGNWMAKLNSLTTFALKIIVIFVFAGLWDQWEGNAGQSIQTCTIITTEPNSLTAPLHGRMPAILNSHDYNLWLDPNIQDGQQLIAILRQYPSEEMETFPIDSFVNTLSMIPPKSSFNASVTPTPLNQGCSFRSLHTLVLGRKRH
jgi:hypothetical protein